MPEIKLTNVTTIINGKINKVNILVSNGIIKQITKGEIRDNISTVINCQDKIVIPGGIDGHMHTEAPFQGMTGGLSFYEQSIIAASGGTTTFIDFTNTTKHSSLYDKYNERIEQMKVSAIDYAVHGKIVEVNNHVLDDIKKMVNEGCTSFKFFMTYKNEGVMCNEEDIIKLFKFAAEEKILCMVHAESNMIANYNLEQLKLKNKLDWLHFPEYKPVICELDAFQHIINLAKITGVQLLIVHTTNKECIDYYIKQCINKKIKNIHVETCPHYLLLTEELLKSSDGFLAIGSPPLRTRRDNIALINAIKNRTIEILGSDDCSFTVQEKQHFIKNGNTITHDFTRVVNGVSGMEIRLHVLLKVLGITPDDISELPNLVRVFSENPARIYGLFPEKGFIREGSDADLVIIDLHKNFNIYNSITYKRFGYTLYHNFSSSGIIETVILRGNIIINKGIFTGKSMGGNYLKRKHPDL